MARSTIFLLLILFVTGTLCSQSYRKDQELFLEAEYFLLFEDYSDALPYYLQLYKTYPENHNIAFRIGLCYLNIPGQKNLSVEYLEKAARNTSATYKEGSLKQTTAPYEAWFFLGNAYRINYQFEQAREAFTTYRETLLPDDTENMLFIDHQINVCTYARELMKNPVSFTEENLGEIFNDSYTNYNPVVSLDGNSIAFMSSLKFYDAVFFSRKEKGMWTSPVNITPDIQSDGDLYISFLTADGNTMYLSKDDDNNSDLYKSTFDGVKWSTAVLLGNNINTKGWESHAVVSSDGEMLIFTSDRPGGQGGLDLYASYLNNDGTWGNPVNLGPEVNTPFNEDRPFITENGQSLFFTSQGHFNMGGFDLFKSGKQQNGQWGKPVNLGYPLNSPDDDVFFLPVNNGKAGYMSLYRPDKGFGNADLYLVTFK